MELQADGVGDHVFMLRVAEVAAGPNADEDLVEALNLNRRGLSFARKVRDQLRNVVETRVWPLFAQYLMGGADAVGGRAEGEELRIGGHNGSGAVRNGHRDQLESKRGDGDRGTGQDREWGNGRGAEWDRDSRRHDQARPGRGGHRSRSRSPTQHSRGGRQSGKDRAAGGSNGRRERLREAGRGEGPRAGRDVRGREDGFVERGPARMEREADGQECPDLRVSGEPATTSELRRMRRAIAVGYAPQIARRMDRNNGYRTLCAQEQSIAYAPPAVLRSWGGHHKGCVSPMLTVWGIDSPLPRFHTIL